MAAPGRPRRQRPDGLVLPCCAVFAVSASVIGLELALMRCLSVAAWHHFSYLVISTALLGFGASGTLLSFARRRLERRFESWSAVLAMAFGVAIVLTFRAAQALPLNVEYALYSLRHGLLMAVYHLLIFIPFLLGATVIGLSLLHLGERTHTVYAANLLGSGAGGLGMLGLMYVLPEVGLLYAASAAAMAGALLWSLCAAGRRVRLIVAVLLVGLPPAVWQMRRPLSLRIDQYKVLAALRRLEAQGDARHLLTRQSPRGRLDVYASPCLRQTLFAGLTADVPPPGQLMITADGWDAGTVYKIRSERQAPILDHTIMSVAYRLRPGARVLLLGETGGANVWLARRGRAASVTVVQSNPQVVELMTGPLRGASGDVFGLPGIEVHAMDLRVFLEQTDRRFDVIQVVSAQGMAAGASRLLSLHEDFLMTREGLALCLRRLSAGGLLTITRGLQSPPRDNVKILATVVEALESLGASRPGDHVVQVRNYLAVTTLASPAPLDAGTCRALAEACGALRLDVEWAPCPGAADSPTFNRIPGPAGAGYSYFRHAALQVLSDRREAFYADWAYNVRPATDDRPYFYDFFRWKSLPQFMRAYGRQWVQRLELGYLLLVAVLCAVLVAGTVLVLVPLLLRRGADAPRGGTPATIAYFVILGTSYMLLEMGFILKFTRFLGDPIISAGIMVSAFLVFSGVGSAVSRRLGRGPARAAAWAALGVGVLAAASAFALDPLFSAAARLTPGWRLAVAAAPAAPVAFLMGWPFPNGLARLGRGAPGLRPLAWGANGFASVAGAPLAVLVGVEWGLTSVLLLAAVLYALAGVAIWGVPGAQARPAENSRSTSSMHS